METWEENLSGLLDSYGYHNLKQRNDKLLHWCQEWAAKVSERDELISSCKMGSDEEHGRIIDIEVKFDRSIQAPYKCSLTYFLTRNGNINLYIKMATYYVPNIKHAFFDKEASHKYEWNNEYLSEIEIFEKSYILQYLTNAFKQFLIWRKRENL